MRRPAPTAPSTAPAADSPRRTPVTRRRWLLWTAGLLAMPVVARQAQKIRRRLRGEPGPTGWFGHC